MNFSRRGLPLIAVLALSGCTNLLGGRDCLLIAFAPPINVAVRDGAGRPQALGAVATFVDQTTSYGDSTRSDSLLLKGGSYNGIYDIYVSKPYYSTTVLRGVQAPYGDQCAGHVDPAITVPAVISLVQNAPPVRSLYLLVGNTTLDRGRDALIGVFLDFSPGASSAVRWRMTGDTASIAFDPLVPRASFVCHVKTGYVMLSATSVVDSTLTDSIKFAIQGHPGSSIDPPCP